MMAQNFSVYMVTCQESTHDDYLNTAYVVALESLKKFRPEKGKFKNYILKCINYELRKLTFNSYREFYYSISIEEFIIDHKDNYRLLSLHYEFNEQSFLMTKNFIDNVLSILTDSQLDLIYCHYYKGMTFKDISKSLGVSPSRVSQLHSETILDIKKIGFHSND